MKGFALVVVLTMSACTSSGQVPTSPVELKHFPLDSLEGVRATTGVSFDPKISADGKGSLRVDANQQVTVPLFEVTDVSIENATLLYQASLQTQGLDGKAFFGDVGSHSWQGRVFLARVGSSSYGHHELDYGCDPFLPPGRTKAGSDPAEPGSAGKGTCVD